MQSFDMGSSCESRILDFTARVTGPGFILGELQSVLPVTPAWATIQPATTATSFEIKVGGAT